VLEGKVFPLLDKRMFTVRNKPAPTAKAVSWKQVLGVFVFYGCSTTATAEEMIREFVTRFTTGRGERALAPYCASVTAAAAAGPRGQDVLRHGLDVDDACFLLLDAFSARDCVPPQALHPNCFTYTSTDFFGPFLMLILVRAIGCQRSREYREAEYRVLRGFARQLLASASWPLAALPIGMLEDPQQREAAAAQVFHPTASAMTADDEKVLQSLGIDAEALRASVPRGQESREVTLRNR
jgi:nuclear pore complex protein Nup98-Nup96